MSVQIDAIYEGSLRCVATHEPSGHTLATDAPTDNGGKGASFSPTDLVATALGTCVLTIIGLVADRHDLQLAGTRVRVLKSMVAQPTRRIGSLKTTVTLPAAAVADSEMRQRLESAARKCPVHASLHPEIDAPIDFVYE
ncbi:MAG: OsmC family protein [Planctomycetota bacterium]